jgi:hypothetical protein
VNRIAELTRLYTAVENTYIPKWDSMPTDLERAMINLYAKILEFQIKAAKYYGMSTLERTARNTVKRDNWDNLHKQIDELDGICKEQMRIADAESIHAIYDIVEKVEKQLTDQEKKKEEVLSWVSNIQVENDHQTVRNKKLGSRYWDSGQWLLEHDEYKKWKVARSEVFWLQGGMGAGKTCLVSIIIQQLAKEAAGEHVAYFYCSRLYTDPTDIIRSFLVQLAYNADGTSIAKELVENYNQRHNADFDSSLGKWVSVLVDIVKANRQTTIIIDALDEFPRSYELLNGLKHVHKSSENVRIFFSSRLGEESVPEQFTNTLGLTILHNNSEDVKIFIKREITAEERLFKSGMKNRPDLSQRLSKILLGRGQWM